MIHHKLNPVGTPRTRSRHEAWLAFRAANLSKESKVFGKADNFSKAFSKALREGYNNRLKYFVHAIRANRGEVKLVEHDGSEHWFNIVNVRVDLPRGMETIFTINPEYEVYHTRQIEVLKRIQIAREMHQNQRYIATDIWSEHFLDFEEGYVANDGTARYDYYVELYNDLPENVTHQTMEVSGTVVSTIYLAAQLQCLDTVTIPMLTRQMRRADVQLTDMDCFTLLALALGYSCHAEATAAMVDWRIPNLHIQEN